MQPTTLSGNLLTAVLFATMAAGNAIPRSSTTTKTVKFEQVTNGKFTGRNGPLALAKAYNKYGVPLPANLQSHVDAASEVKRDEGTGIATPDNGDLEYTVPVKIGTPAQTLNLDFDTGSADLWVFSSETAGQTSSHDLYRPSRSSTAQKANGLSWSITYGDQSSSSGDVYFDKVTIGGLTVNKQAVESAQKVSSQFITSSNDGLVGLSFSNGNTVKPTKQNTWFDNIKGSLDSPLFTADLRHNAPGSYLFGGIPDEADGLLYATLDKSQGFWAFNTQISGIRGSISAIADTGTTLLLVSNSVVNSYYGNVRSAKFDNQQGGITFDCSERLPDFVFSVGSGSITVPGSLINYAPISSRTCFGGLQAVPQGLPFSIFGDVALKAAYVVFDDGNNQIGWAQKV